MLKFIILKGGKIGIRGSFTATYLSVYIEMFGLPGSSTVRNPPGM